MDREYGDDYSDKPTNELNLKCKLCLQPFSSPKALPCLHTFCRRCLETYCKKYCAEDSRQFKCPVCRKTTEFPKGGVGSFMDNVLMTQLSDVVNIESRGSSAVRTSNVNWCKACMESGSRTTKARHKCYNCDINLCDVCQVVHKESQLTAGHTTQILPTENVLYCRMHARESVLFYCHSCCMCLCAICSTFGHKNCRVAEIKEVCLDKCNLLKVHMSRLDEKMPQVKSELDMRSTMAGKLREHLDKEEFHIRELESKLQGLSDASILSTKALQSNMDAEFLCLADPLLEQMNAMLKTENGLGANTYGNIDHLLGTLDIQPNGEALVAKAKPPKLVYSFRFGLDDPSPELPTHVAVNNSGFVAVTNRCPDGILIYNPKCNTVSGIANILDYQGLDYLDSNKPTGLSSLDDKFVVVCGRVFVIDGEIGRVDQKLTASISRPGDSLIGGVISRPGDSHIGGVISRPGDSHIGGVCTNQAHLLVTTLGLFANGSHYDVTRPMGGTTNCSDITGNIVYTNLELHGVKVYPPVRQNEGVLTFGSWGIGPHQFDKPRYAAIDTDGKIYVSDWGNNCIKVYTLDSQFIYSLGEEQKMSHPCGVVVYRDYILVADCGNDRISMYIKGGKLLKHLLTREDDICCPMGIAMTPEHDLVVSHRPKDKRFHEVRVYHVEGFQR